MSVDEQNPHRSHFSQRLRALRLAAGYKTAKSFAAVIAVDQNTYTRYERGEVEPSIHILDRIWIALKLPANKLLGHPATSLLPDKRAEPSEQTDHLLTMSSPYHGIRVQPATRLAWQIAMICAEFDHHEPDDTTKSSPQFAKLRRRAQHFEELKAEPFSKLSAIGNHPALPRLDPQLRRALAEAIDKMTILLMREKRPPKPSAR